MPSDREAEAERPILAFMTIVDGEAVELETPSGPMRTHILRPSAPGRYPALILFSEIFQITAPIRRMAAFFAGHGYVVACPEVYHEFEPAGTVLAYDQAGSDRGNDLKYRKTIAAYDADAHALVEHLLSRDDATESLAAWASVSAAISPSAQASIRTSERQCASMRPICTQRRLVLEMIRLNEPQNFAASS